MRTICSIHHIHCEMLGTVADVLKQEGIAIDYVRTFQGQPVPRDLSGHDGLIVMGGPMGVYEQNQHAHLRDEIRLIQHALREEKPILGVCLGSQLLAAALGAPVTKGQQKEIGWLPVTLTDAAAQDSIWSEAPRRFTAMVWHGDIFELPRGAVTLASTELTEQQAFRYGKNAYGILFHMEVTEKMVGDWVAEFAKELRDAQIDGRPIIAHASKHLPALQKIGDAVFRGWAKLVKARAL